MYSLENKITLKEIAKILNKTSVTIYRITEYKTTPSPKLAKKISDLTGISILELLYPNENFKINQKSNIEKQHRSITICNNNPNI